MDAAKKQEILVGPVYNNMKHLGCAIWVKYIGPQDKRSGFVQCMNNTTNGTNITYLYD